MNLNMLSSKKKKKLMKNENITIEKIQTKQNKNFPNFEMLILFFGKKKIKEFCKKS